MFIPGDFMSKRIKGLIGRSFGMKQGLFLLCCFLSVLGIIAGTLFLKYYDSVSLFTASIDILFKCDGFFEAALQSVSSNRFLIYSLIAALSIYGIIAVPIFSFFHSFFGAAVLSVYIRSCGVYQIYRLPVSFLIFRIFLLPTALFFLSEVIFLSLGITSKIFGAGTGSIVADRNDYLSVFLLLFLILIFDTISRLL